MPVTFKSKHSPDIVMLDNTALALLKILGHSGTVPGSIAAEDVAAALARLDDAAKQSPDQVVESGARDDNDDDADDSVDLARRALPLRELLAHAVAGNNYVYWER